MSSSSVFASYCRHGTSGDGHPATYAVHSIVWCITLSTWYYSILVKTPNEVFPFFNTPSAPLQSFGAEYLISSLPLYICSARPIYDSTQVPRLRYLDHHGEFKEKRQVRMCVHPPNPSSQFPTTNPPTHSSTAFIHAFTHSPGEYPCSYCVKLAVKSSQIKLIVAVEDLHVHCAQSMYNVTPQLRQRLVHFIVWCSVGCRVQGFVHGCLGHRHTHTHSHPHTT